MVNQAGSGNAEYDRWLETNVREQRQTVHAQPPRDVFSERDFARIGSTDGDVDIARVVDRAQNTGDGDAHGRALIALQSIDETPLLVENHDVRLHQRGVDANDVRDLSGRSLLLCKRRRSARPECR